MDGSAHQCLVSAWVAWASSVGREGGAWVHEPPHCYLVPAGPAVPWLGSQMLELHPRCCPSCPPAGPGVVAAPDSSSAASFAGGSGLCAPFLPRPHPAAPAGVMCCLQRGNCASLGPPTVWAREPCRARGGLLVAILRGHRKGSSRSAAVPCVCLMPGRPCFCCCGFVPVRQDCVGALVCSVVPRGRFFYLCKKCHWNFRLGIVPRL